MMRFTVPWGIPEFDQVVGGIPANVFNVLESEDHASGLLALGQFLNEGVQAGERVAMITSENPLSFMESFEAWGIEFSSAIDSDQFCFLNYRPNVLMEVGLAADYDSVFSEIHRLSDEGVHRIAIHQMDNLFNMNSHMLINNCAHKIVAATANSRSTILGQFVQFHDDSHSALRIAALKTMTSYFSLRRHTIHKPQGCARPYELMVERVPWLESIGVTIQLCLQDGRGLVGVNSEGSKSGSNNAA